MIATLKQADGTERQVEVDSLTVTVGGARIKLSVAGNPERLRVLCPSGETSWHRLVVHPGAANVISIEPCMERSPER
jgi:hypothetical protein